MNAEKAIQNFRSGLNCAQSVLATYSSRFGMDENAALTVSCGFGAGMGRLQETCGAVTGAFMVIGVHVGKQYPENSMRKSVSYKLIQDFEAEFTKMNKSIKCMDLINVDLRTDEGQKQFSERMLGTKVCEKCIANATEIIDRLIK